MHGPDILTTFLSEIGPLDKYGQRWQYHPRSDRHSKVGCWGVALDLLSQSALMREHARTNKIVLGVNHEMRDYHWDRKKDLDLVIARPASEVPDDGPTFGALADRYGIVLTGEQQRVLDDLPELRIAPVGAVLVALEAKACMTAHVRALPRLYDELNSSHLCVHGASSQALAIAYVQINHADDFISPVINSKPMSKGLEAEVTPHRQPADTKRVLDKVAQIPRRSAKGTNGFDAIGITVLNLRNDGSPVELVNDDPAPQPGTNFYYDTMIVRMANEYDATFSHI